jgi:hypothetical protein
MTTPSGQPEELPEQAIRNLERLRGLSMAERGRMIEAVCRDAAAIQASRSRLGLPLGQPAPWPHSTFEFLRQHAPHGRA